MMCSRVSAVVAVAACLAVALSSPSPARAAAPPQTPESRMLDVWLDLRLLAVFYPETTAETFLPNLKKVAGQLNQHLAPVRFGNAPRDALRFKSGTVVIARNPPPDTWILYTRAGPRVWELFDDPTGRLRIRRVKVR